MSNNSQNLELNIEKLHSWSKKLLKVGWEFSEETKARGEDVKTTLAVCVPRIDFAAAFLALGILASRSEGQTLGFDLKQLKKMEGQWVSFQGRSSREIGVLSSVPDDEEGLIHVTMYKKKLPDFSKMTVAEAQSVKPPSTTLCEELLIPKRWHTIQPVVDAEAFQIEKGVKRRKKFSESNINRARKVWGIFNEEQARWITETSEVVATIICNKARFQEEIELPIEFNKEIEKTELRSILRPASGPLFRGTEHSKILSNSRFEKSELSEISLLESGPNIYDSMRRTYGTNRIVLLDRNSPSYYLAAAKIREDYTERKGDYELKGHSHDYGIVTLGFRHHGIF